MATTKAITSSADIQAAISRHNKLCILVGDLLSKEVIAKARKEVDVHKLRHVSKFVNMVETALDKLSNNGIRSNVSFVHMPEYETSHVHKSYNVNVVFVYAGVMSNTGEEVNYMANLMPNKAKKQVIITTKDKYVSHEYACYYYGEN